MPPPAESISQSRARSPRNVRNSIARRPASAEAASRRRFRAMRRDAGGVPQTAPAGTCRASRCRGFPRRVAILLTITAGRDRYIDRLDIVEKHSGWNGGRERPGPRSTARHEPRYAAAGGHSPAPVSAARTLRCRHRTIRRPSHSARRRGAALVEQRRNEGRRTASERNLARRECAASERAEIDAVQGVQLIERSS